MITAITAAVTAAIAAAKSSAIHPLLKYIGNVIAQGTIWAAFTGLTDVFRTTEDATHDLNQALTETLSPLELQNERVARLAELHGRLEAVLQQTEEATTGLQHAQDRCDGWEHVDRLTALRQSYSDLTEEITSLNREILETSLDTAVGEIEALQAAYNAAYETALASINSPARAVRPNELRGEQSCNRDGRYMGRSSGRHQSAQ